ncbi:MAG: DUF4364 family protein [Oscillospiraceae bacterium]|nr:DUF4364 family protein [Oscillospiraceae bacterium]
MELDEKQIRTQAKIFILYILGNIDEPVEFSTVNDMILQDGLVGYFDFAPAFSELLEQGQLALAARTPEGEPLYTITPQGRAVLETYEQELLSDDKDRAIRHALRVLAQKRDGIRQTSRLTESGNGWTVTCTIEDKQKVLFETSVFLSDHPLAERLRNNFDDRADIIYRGVLALLSGDVDFIFDA